MFIDDFFAVRIVGKVKPSKVGKVLYRCWSDDTCIIPACGLEVEVLYVHELRENVGRDFRSRRARKRRKRKGQDKGKGGRKKERVKACARAHTHVHVHVRTRLREREKEGKSELLASESERASNTLVTERRSDGQTDRQTDAASPPLLGSRSRVTEPSG